MTTPPSKDFINHFIIEKTKQGEQLKKSPKNNIIVLAQ
jgi:hypothetical protein